MKRKLFSLVIALFTMLLVVSASISAPILCRPFYYAHIVLLDLPGRTGFSAEEIRQAFDEMMDFCVGGAPFGTGVLQWSQSGMSHFADCAVLFRLDFVLAIDSALVLLCCLGLSCRGLQPAGLLRHGPAFWAGSVLSLSFLILAGLAALDFDGAFAVFHQLLFPHKENWRFDAAADQIILILPEVFFRDCAILIVAVLFLLCFLLILWDCRTVKQKKRARGRPGA